MLKHNKLASIVVCSLAVIAMLLPGRSEAQHGPIGRHSTNPCILDCVETANAGYHACKEACKTCGYWLGICWLWHYESICILPCFHSVVDSYHACLEWCAQNP